MYHKECCVAEAVDSHQLN